MLLPQSRRTATLAATLTLVASLPASDDAIGRGR